LWCGAAAGHKVNVLAYVEGDQVVVEGYFSAKAKAMNCQVEILDAQGTKLYEGRTDAQGMCRLPMSALGKVSGDLKIVLHAGMGHQADYVLRASELAASAPAPPKGVDKKPVQEGSANRPESRAPDTPTSPSEPATVSSAMQTAGPGQTHSPLAPPIDVAALTKALEGAIDRKIEPLVRMLGQQQKMLMEQKDRGPSLSDIIGGVGWIIGIVGIAAYFRGRKRTRM